MNYRFIALLLSTFCILALNETAQAEGRTNQISSARVEPIMDSKGFINVWALRHDAIALSNITQYQESPEYYCENQSEGEAEDTPAFKNAKARIAYQKKQAQLAANSYREQQKCINSIKKAQVQSSNIISQFNQKWKPVIFKATQLGDPVAEVILRTCDTIPLLNRDDVSSDCSTSESERSFAHKQLETLQFKPALYQHKIISDAQFKLNDCPSDTRECHNLTEIARHKKMLEMAESGYFGMVEYWNTCNNRDSNPRLDLMNEECQRLKLMIEAMQVEANRFYSATNFENQNTNPVIGLNLSRPILSGESGLTNGHEIFDSRSRLSRNDRSKFSDPKFNENFYNELNERIHNMERNIDQDLQRDPRWAVFLIERRAGLLFEAFNPFDPKRPSDDEVLKYEENSIRGKALKKATQEQKWARMDLTNLIQTLYETRNTRLYYSFLDFPLNLTRLIKEDVAVSELINAYHSDKNDGIFRFNMIMILKYKLQKSQLNTDDIKMANECLVESLNDKDPWVRTEGVHGLQFYSTNRQYKNEILKLLNDPDSTVQQEARNTSSRLHLPFE